MTTTATTVKAKNTPRYLRIYDSPEYGDRYTIVFGRKAAAHGSLGPEFMYIAASENPTSPLGIYQHGFSKRHPCDRNGGAHLGKRIAFSDLPDTLQKLLREEYAEFWQGTKGEIWE